MCTTVNILMTEFIDATTQSDNPNPITVILPAKGDKNILMQEAHKIK